MPVVFVVEDDASVRRSLGRLLRGAGFDVRLYEDPERFLRELTPAPGACVLLDVTMPQVGGLSVLERLRAQGHALPVIMVTARDDEATRREVLERGALLCLGKPVDGRVLIDAIRWAIRPHTEPSAG